MSRGFAVVGRAIPKRDAYAKVTGAAGYAADLRFPGMLHAAILRSHYAHARITAIDTSRAEAMDGVVAVLHHGNTSARPFTTSEWDAPAALGSLPRDQVLFSAVARHVGQAVAAVAAVDENLAAAAAEAIAVSFEPLPVVIDADAAMQPGAPSVNPDHEGNVAAHVRFSAGDVDSALREADQVIERRFRTSRQKQTPMEPFACVAQYDGHTLTLWSPNQTPHQTRVKLADIFGMAVGNVRIITPTLGGGFGARSGLIGEPWAAALAIATRRPVRLVYSRYEDFVATEGRHPATVTLRVGFKNDGTPTAIHGTALLNTGPYASQGPNVTAFLGMSLLRPYRCGDRRYDGYTVFTNAPPASAFRGFGAPQAMFALEQVIDEIAERVGKDPLEFRLEHLAGKGDEDYALMRPIDSDALHRCLREGATAIGWAAKRGKGGGSGPWRRGVGMAVSIYVSGTACLGDTLTEAAVANVRLNADGTVTLLTGATDCGTGCGTSLAQIAAEELGVPMESVHVVMGDTDVTPLDLGAHATRTLFVGGLAVRAAARDARDQALRVAADLLEVSAADLDAADGAIRVRGVPGTSVTYGQVATAAFKTVAEISGRGVAPQHQATPYGAQFAEVEVNVRTGQVRVLRLVAAHDVGRAINPLIVEGQIEGGAVQGIGYALTEDMPVDADGQPLAASFMDYRVLTASDVPLIESLVIEAPDPAGPFGAKGVGEVGIIPTAAAIANAIYDAVGVRLTELPMTPARVLEALRRTDPTGAASSSRTRESPDAR